MAHDTRDTFDDIVHKGEIAFAVTEIENLDGFAFTEFVGKAEIRHVGPSGRTIDGEETKSCGRYII